ncbi:cyclic dehypoxanthinyl futalosine synthase [Pseudodesulfovibrio thermohalotolerans]|uniref:cyclic dehypoxanthinyl futalosine synthase n=1 Tax=Pseudodesulfovibrio thermohalotolerans TaxID=2880651 RepID=UPI0022B9F514|nr:cyclic dehypoxanthinyl futalosine synthase [Pseudodesulfovibrio thermohalotolerans]WFS63702.1 cyclic dehypoxanthinyl futalosine synthase [Pseudodesulfovibrio thermohalotolerans]
MSELKKIFEKVLDGERIDFQESELLYAEADFHALGQLAHQVRLNKHPEPLVTYVVDRNINYSNVCVCCCKFCAFYREPGDKDGYVLSFEEIGRKIDETVALGGTQILMQGGHHPDLPLTWYEEMLRWIKANHPVHIHAFSPPEVVFWSEKEGITVAEVIHRLRAAGLDSIPGGGAEILVDEVRSRVAPNKCPSDQWLGVMEEAHNQGLRTTATMMFGHLETPAQRLEHLFRVREVQDRTGGFTAFIPWTFQPDHTALSRCRKLTSVEYLRTLAVSRIVLDNVDNIQVSWVTMGPKIAQLALYFGGNDFGSTMIEENVVKAAGVAFRLSCEEIHRLVEGAGFIPRQRTMDYTLMETK